MWQAIALAFDDTLSGRAVAVMQGAWVRDWTEQRRRNDLAGSSGTSSSTRRPGARPAVDLDVRRTQGGAGSGSVTLYFEQRAKTYIEEVLVPALGISVFYHVMEFAEGRGQIHFHLLGKVVEH